MRSHGNSITNAQISVALIEPSPAFALGLRVLLERHDPEFHVVGTYRDLDSFYGQPPGEELDMIILNTAVLGFSLYADIRELLPDYAQIPIVALTIEFILPEALASFDGAIHIYDGEEHIARQLKSIFKASSSFARPRTENVPLTDRERDVITAIARGRSNKEIADDLCLSPHTVSTYRKRISSKFGIRGAAGFTAYAIAHKLIGQ